LLFVVSLQRLQVLQVGLIFISQLLQFFQQRGLEPINERYDD
jgi:hypothetical protein